MNPASIKQAAESNFQLWQQIRRYLHRHPERSFEEFQTSAYIQNRLKEWDIPFTAGWVKTGILAKIEGENPTKGAILLRADMDALPIQELNHTDYTSINDGIMHACGHDVHCTCLLGALKILFDMRHHWEGTIYGLFQPGEEEWPGGAKLFLESKALQSIHIDAALALHVYPELPCGHLGVCSGTYMASTDEIHITVKGKGGHAALPDRLADPVIAAAHLLVTLQQVVARKAAPSTPTVLSFGKIEAKGASNIIPNEVYMAGTLRTFDETWRSKAHEWIQSIAKHTCEALGTTAEVNIKVGYPVLVNDSLLSSHLIPWAENSFGKEKIHQLALRTTAEDFAYISQKYPSFFFRLGTHSPDGSKAHGVHTPYFDIDESALISGITAMAGFAIHALAHK